MGSLWPREVIYISNLYPRSLSILDSSDLYHEYVWRQKTLTEHGWETPPKVCNPWKTKCTQNPTQEYLSEMSPELVYVLVPDKGELLPPRESG